MNKSIFYFDGQNFGLDLLVEADDQTKPSEYYIITGFSFFLDDQLFKIINILNNSNVRKELVTQLTDR